MFHEGKGTGFQVVSEADFERNKSKDLETPNSNREDVDAEKCRSPTHWDLEASVSQNSASLKGGECKPCVSYLQKSEVIFQSENFF